MPNGFKSGCVAFFLLMSAAAAQTSKIPEPTGLWHGPMHGATPATLSGATVINAKELKRLLSRQRPLLIDVANLPHASDRNLASSIASHRSIPGATWLPGAGRGDQSTKFSRAFDAEISRLTNDDKTKPIVTFCHHNRWGSWNAAKRLVQLGYSHVYWLPGGAESWPDRNGLVRVGEDRAWSQTSPANPRTP